MTVHSSASRTYPLYIYLALRLAGALLIATLVPFLIDRRAQRSDRNHR